MKNHPEIYDKAFIMFDKQKLSFLTPAQSSEALKYMNLIRTTDQILTILKIAELPKKLIKRDFKRLCYIVENSEQDQIFQILFLANDFEYKQRVHFSVFQKLKSLDCKANCDAVSEIAAELADISDKYISLEQQCLQH